MNVTYVVFFSMTHNPNNHEKYIRVILIERYYAKCLFSTPQMYKLPKLGNIWETDVSLN